MKRASILYPIQHNTNRKAIKLSLCLNDVQVHLNKLECRVKVHLFQ